MLWLEIRINDVLVAFFTDDPEQEDLIDLGKVEFKKPPRFVLDLDEVLQRGMDFFTRPGKNEIPAVQYLPLMNEVLREKVPGGREAINVRGIVQGG